ncbi:MAG: hypothetical protein BroJett040_24040 [Oligoflexia bacterium]|nr:MAG: hypothetical protein BroJett040_24040 [Oligoflexia bacterium]
MKYFLLLFFIPLSNARATELLTNSTRFQNPPKWLTSTRVNRIADNIQSKMEWSIRRAQVIWYSNQADFQQAHKMGEAPIAVSNKTTNTIHLGPKVTTENFDQVFGHELVHIVSYQKYKESIPKWLEEGFANSLAKAGKVDYPWLARQKRPEDVRSLIHPLNGSPDHIRFHYMASQALVEMLSAKCDIRNLMRLSVGMKMEPYIQTYCNIPDLNKAFDQWVTAKK